MLNGDKKLNTTHTYKAERKERERKKNRANPKMKKSNCWNKNQPDYDDVDDDDDDQRPIIMIIMTGFVYVQQEMDRFGEWNFQHATTNNKWKNKLTVLIWTTTTTNDRWYLWRKKTLKINFKC